MAEIKLLPVSEHGQPLYWNSISRFDFDVCVVIGILFCICMPNFVIIRWSAAELWRHIDFFQDGGHRVGNVLLGAGLVMTSFLFKKVEIYLHAKFLWDSPIHGWDKTISGFEKQTAAILEFYFRFDFDVCVVIGLSFCIGLQNFVKIELPSAELWRHVHFFQDGGRQPYWIWSG